LAARTTLEHWRHTSLDRVTSALTALARNPPSPPVLSGDASAMRLQECAPEQTRIVKDAFAELANANRYPHATLVALGADDGWLVEVATEAAVRLEPGVGPSVVVIDVAPGAQLDLVESRSHDARASADAAAAADAVASGDVLLVRIGAGARVRHARFVARGAGTHWNLVGCWVGANAHYQLDCSAVGADIERLECLVALDAAGAACELRGAAVIGAGRHLDQRYVIEHRAPDTRSTSRFHCMARSRGKATFNGRIHIYPHARGVVADLVSRNLALDPDAEINTKPELEIYNDDVRCSHGATIGKLDAQALFYLLSRGIALSEARRALARAFLLEVNHGALADVVRTGLLEALDD
jgi:Fe-S cluster assembly scaffold protein SufB